VPDVSQVVFHLALCRAAVSASANASTVPMHVVVRYDAGLPFIDKVLQAPLGSNGDATVELGLPRGHEFVSISQPASGCGARDLVTILPDHGRRIEETLTAGNDAKPLPAFEMSGTASLSFLATTKPTLVAFPTGLACDAAAPPVLPIDVNVTYDGGAYYLSMLDDRALTTDQPVLALSLHTPSGRPHYVRLPATLATRGHGIVSITMNVTDDMVDGMATEPQNVLLCPKIWETSVR